MIGTRGLPASYGGVEVAVEALSRELARSGHSVTVYGRSSYCDADLTELDGVHQIVLPQIDTKHLEAISHTVFATAHAVSRGSYDVVHYHATGPSLLSLVTRPLGIPTVSTIHGLDWRREKWGGVARGALKVAARTAATVPDRTIVVSRELAGFLERKYGAASAYIPNGVDLSGFGEEFPIPELASRPFLLHLGRIVPEKQAHVLIEAYAKVPGEHRLAIVGPSSHSDDYLRRVEELARCDERVLLLGARYGAEKTWLLRHAQAFVQPSTLEGMPIALLEALSLNKRTIVSDIPENVEVVNMRDGVPHGLVFRTGDVDDLSDKLAQVLARDDGAEAEGAEAEGETPIDQVVREHYDWQRIARKTEQVYFEALGRRNVPRHVG